MNTQLNGTSYTADIESEITRIRVFIEEELGEKQELIRQKDRQLAELKIIALKKDQAIGSLEAKLKELDGEMDGNRQLINKLLGDLSKLQNDIEWYRRTYEKRSLLGTIREKLFRKH